MAGGASSPSATPAQAASSAARSAAVSGAGKSGAGWWVSASRSAKAASLTGATGTRSKKRSWKASSDSSVGASLLAPITLISGVRSRAVPLSNSRSLSSVNSALRMAELALNTSSRNATPAVGR